MTVATSAAFAKSCSAGKMVAERQGQRPGARLPVGFTDTVLTSIDLAVENVALADYEMRLQRLPIQAGRRGALAQPWRPADSDLLMIVQLSHMEDQSKLTIPFPGRSIFDLQEEIEGLLRNCSETQGWHASHPPQPAGPGPTDRVSSIS
jgi:hypothetical protein